MNPMNPTNPTETKSSQLADELLAVDGAMPAAGSADAMFERMLEDERRFERRVRRTATVGWGVAFGCLCVFAATFVAVRNLDDGAVIELLRGLIVVVSLTGVVASLIAAVATVGWLFRARTPTLKAIERRLAALERSLSS